MVFFLELLPWLVGLALIIFVVIKLIMKIDKIWLKYGLIFFIIDMSLVALYIVIMFFSYGTVFEDYLGLTGDESDLAIPFFLSILSVPAFIIGAVVGNNKSKNRIQNKTS